MLCKEAGEMKVQVLHLQSFALAGTADTPAFNFLFFLFLI